jgi:hypothetical protein
MMPQLARYACMLFAVSNIVGVLVFPNRDAVMLVGAFLVGGAWFAFGYYGGLPLVDTVDDWHPPVTPNAVEEMHKRGLRVMRRRRWIVWAALPGGLALAALILSILAPTGHPEFVVLILAPPLAIINGRYYLSRCPRCGLGFFTRSRSRAALLRESKKCGHCGLPLNAYKDGVVVAP